MIEIYINSELVKLDNTAVVSLNLVNFDIKDISNRSLNYTNDFKIPVYGNDKHFGFAASPYGQGDTPYTDFEISIVAGSYSLLTSGRGWITSISDGYYNITVTDKSGAIQDMKDFSLGTERTKTYDTTATSILEQTLLATSEYKADILYSQWQYDFGITNPSTYSCDLHYMPISIFIKSIFEYFETDSGYTFAGSLWTDAEFAKIRTLVYSHAIVDAGTNIDQVYKAIINPTHSFFDLFKEVLKLFCATFKVNGTVITIERFDSLDWDSPVDWSNKIVSIKSKKFRIPGTSINNYLRYTAENGSDKTLNQVNLECNNENLTNETELIKMDASVYPLVGITPISTSFILKEQAIFLPDKDVSESPSPIYQEITTNKSIDKFVFITDGDDVLPIGFKTEMWYFRSGVPYFASRLFTLTSTLPIATYYNSVNDYVRIAAMLQNPVFYEVELNLTAKDMQGFDPFNIVKIEELGGTFYVNSIKNYLLSSDKNTATVELIKIS